MAETLKIDPVKPDAQVIARAALAMSKGGLVAFPTDTFYALGADPFNELALRRLFEVKGRPLDKPLPLLIGEEGQALLVAPRLPEMAMKLARTFWPGALTIIVPSGAGLPRGVAAGGVGLRMPDSAVARAICVEFGRPVTGTSANISGGPEPRSGHDVELAIGPQIDLIIDGGRSDARLGSTVVDLTGSRPKLLREGVVRRWEIERTIGDFP